MPTLCRLVAVSAVSLCTLAWAQSAPPAPAPMKLGIGDQRIISVPGLSRVALGDDSIADIKTLGQGELLVLGTKPGHTTLVLMAGPARYLLEIEVAKNGPSEPGVAAGITDVTPSVSETLRLTAKQAVTRPVKDLERLAVGDAEVADVKANKDGVTVIGGKPGATSVLLWLKGGARQTWNVEVK